MKQINQVVSICNLKYVPFGFEVMVVPVSGHCLLCTFTVCSFFRSRVNFLKVEDRSLD